jgi:hypothetical protein
MSTNKVRILYLEADSADAETVGALVGIVREVQGGRSISGTVELFETGPVAEAQIEALTEASEPNPGLAAPRKARNASAGGRVKNAGPQLLAALRKSPRPDRIKLAKAIYGDEGKTAKVSQLLSYLVASGKIESNGDGSFKVL